MYRLVLIEFVKRVAQNVVVSVRGEGNVSALNANSPGNARKCSDVRRRRSVATGHDSDKPGNVSMFRGKCAHAIRYIGAKLS